MERMPYYDKKIPLYQSYPNILLTKFKFIKRKVTTESYSIIYDLKITMISTDNQKQL